MSEDQFNILPFHEKIKRLYVDGDFIIAIRYYGYKINLYVVFNFFVEVFYNHKEDRIEKVVLLERDSSRMKFYFAQIKLPTNLLS